MSPLVLPTPGGQEREGPLAQMVGSVMKGDNFSALSVRTGL